MVGFLELKPFLAGEAGTFQADAVQAAHAVDAAYDGERRQVEAHPGAALHHGHRADAAKLVYHGVAGDEGTIADHYVAGDQHAIGQDDFVADDGVMADMAVGHKKILRADLRVFAGRVGAVNGDVFAEAVSVADDEPGRFAVVLQILRRVANHAAGVEAVLRADRGVAGEVHMRGKLASRADRDVFVDNRVRADSHALVQLCAGVNNGSGVDHA